MHVDLRRAWDQLEFLRAVAGAGYRASRGGVLYYGIVDRAKPREKRRSEMITAHMTALWARDP